MKTIAENRAQQLREHFDFKDAGVYDPAGVGGTGVTTSCTMSRIRKRMADCPVIRMFPGSYGFGKDPRSGWGTWRCWAEFSVSPCTTFASDPKKSVRRETETKENSGERLADDPVGPDGSSARKYCTVHVRRTSQPPISALTHSYRLITGLRSGLRICSDGNNRRWRSDGPILASWFG
jgi:hypothetical protein